MDKGIQHRAVSESAKQDCSQSMVTTFREAEQRYRMLFEQSPDGVVLLDPQTALPIEFNTAAHRQLGYTREEYARLRSFDHEATETPGETRGHIDRILGQGKDDFVTQHRTKQGQLRQVQVTVQTLQLASRTVLHCVLRDVTERKRAEEALKDSEERFRRIFENAPIGLYQSTPRGSVGRANPALARMFGFETTAEMLANFSDVSAFFVNPAQRQKLVQAALNSAGYVREEVEYRRKDGTTFLGSVHMRAVRDPWGQPELLEGFIEDITERRQLEEQLRQAQKMEAIGQLAGGVAHDFNNILAATLMHLGMLQENPQLTLDTKESLKDVESATMRAAGLTRQLLLFSRRQMARIEPLDLNQLIHGLLKMLRRLLGENIEVVSHDPSEAVWVRADAGMLEQVVMNLCINGRDAMPKGGRLALATTLVELGAPPAQPNPNARPGRFVCLSVTDTGCGMDEAVLKRIYEPFFTTKEVGKGTGLGLATVYGIVQQHEGWVEVDSAVGKGSSFRVYLPAGTRPLGASVLPSGPEKTRGGSETILLVEDELSMRQTAALCLRKLGYAVLEAGNGLEALQVWKAHQEQITLLFSDMVMPGEMTGLELAQRMRREKASLKVIISSGYSTDLTGSTPLAGQEISYLPKPYKTALLAKTVRSCLDQT